MLRQRTKFADLRISVVLYPVCCVFVKPLEDSVSEAVCIRQDLACGLEAYEVRKSKSCADSGDEVASKTAGREPHQVIESTSHRPS